MQVDVKISKITVCATPQNKEETEECNWMDEYTNEQIHSLQNQDPDLKPMMTWKEDSEERPKGREVTTASPVTRNLWLLWDSVIIQNGILFRKWYDNSGKTSLRLIVPRVLQNEILDR